MQCQRREKRRGVERSVCVAMRFPCNSLSLLPLGRAREGEEEGERKSLPSHLVRLSLLFGAELSSHPAALRRRREEERYIRENKCCRIYQFDFSNFFFGDCRKEREKGKSDFLPSPPFFSR